MLHSALVVRLQCSGGATFHEEKKFFQFSGWHFPRKNPLIKNQNFTTPKKRFTCIIFSFFHSVRLMRTRNHSLAHTPRIEDKAGKIYHKSHEFTIFWFIFPFDLIFTQLHKQTMKWDFHNHNLMKTLHRNISSNLLILQNAKLNWNIHWYSFFHIRWKYEVIHGHNSSCYFIPWIGFDIWLVRNVSNWYIGRKIPKNFDTMMNYFIL